MERAKANQVDFLSEPCIMLIISPSCKGLVMVITEPWPKISVCRLFQHLQTNVGGWSEWRMTKIHKPYELFHLKTVMHYRCRKISCIATFQRSQSKNKCTRITTMSPGSTSLNSHWYTLRGLGAAEQSSRLFFPQWCDKHAVRLTAN